MQAMLIAALALALTAGCAAAETRRLLHDGIDRSFIVDFPSTEGPAPAVVVLHGGGGSARQVRRHTGFALDERGFVQIYPDAVDRNWNDGRLARDGTELRGTDDLGLILAIVDGLVAEGRVDPSRVFATGISNGGAMSQRLVCQAPGRIAGAAVVAMNFPVGLDCPPGPAVPMLFILGTADPLVPHDGGPVGRGRSDRGAVASVEDTLSFYAVRNGCDGSTSRPLPDIDPGDGILLEYHEGLGCSAAFGALIAEGGGHTWPGAREVRLIARIVGPTARDISATAEISAFFEALAAR